jgi:hypothetical protein
MSVNSNPASIKYEKTFCLKNFLIYRRWRWHRWLSFTFEYLHEFSWKFEKARLGYLEEIDIWNKLKSRVRLPLTLQNCFR